MRQDHCPFRKKEAIRSGYDGLHLPRFTNRALSTSRDKSVYEILTRGLSAQIMFSSVSSTAKPARRKINLTIRQNGFHYVYIVSLPPSICNQNDVIWQIKYKQQQLYKELSNRSSLCSPPRFIDLLSYTSTNEFHVPQGRIT